MKYAKASLLILTALLSNYAFSDDAIEGAPSGNIVFETAPELVMQDETLTISKSSGAALGSEKFNIDVDFHFKNISQHDVTRKIAFVLPPVQCREDAASMWRGLDAKDGNKKFKGLQDFTTKVDGKNQAYIIRTEAYLGKRNIGKLLSDLHLPQNPCDIKMGNDGMPDSQYGDVLKKNHLLTNTNDPAWQQNIYFEWTQTFPAGKVINIRHRYTPVVGEAVIAKRSTQELNDIISKNSSTQKPIWSADLSSLKQGDSHCAMPMWVQYHLTTGAYWKGGIGHFKLVLNDKDGAPIAINQFYNSSDPVKKSTTKKSMTFEIKNFIPTQNLRILYLALPHNDKEKKMCGE